MNIYYARVLKQESEYKYSIKPLKNVGSAVTQKTMVATVLSPMPTVNGSGFKAAAPEKFNNLNALCMQDGNDVYILGFVPISPGMGAGTARQTTDNEPGGFVLATADNTHIKAYSDGALSMSTDEWAQIKLEPIAQLLFGMFKSMIIRWWTGRFTVATIGNNSTAQFYFGKQPDYSALPQNKLPVPDNFTLNVGEIEKTKSIITWAMRERYTPDKIPDFVLLGHLGVQDKVAMHAASESVSLKTTSYLDWCENGKLQFDINDKTNENHLFVQMDAATPEHVKFTATGKGASKKFNAVLGTGDKALTLNIGENKADLTIASTGETVLAIGTDKCIITIKPSGDVTIKTTDAAKIKLGGTGQEQALVTEAWIKQIFATHMHPSAAPGPPSPPMMPTPPTSADAKTSFTTFTTLAE